MAAEGPELQGLCVSGVCCRKFGRRKHRERSVGCRKVGRDSGWDEGLGHWLEMQGHHGIRKQRDFWGRKRHHMKKK